VNVLITVVVLFFVTLAMAQVVIFDLRKDLKERVPLEIFNLHHAIAVIGTGAAGYALFVAEHHFSPAGHMGLVAAVIGIALVGWIIQKRRRKTVPEEREEIPEDKIASREPDETKSWCPKCQAHTTTRKARCAHCNYYMVFVPTANRKASYGCGACALVPLSVMTWALLAKFQPPDMGIAIAMLMVLGFLLIAAFPAFFLYQIRLWKKWARQKEAGSEKQGDDNPASHASLE